MTRSVSERDSTAALIELCKALDRVGRLGGLWKNDQVRLRIDFGSSVVMRWKLDSFGMSDFVMETRNVEDRWKLAHAGFEIYRRGIVQLESFDPVFDRICSQVLQFPIDVTLDDTATFLSRLKLIRSDLENQSSSFIMVESHEGFLRHAIRFFANRIPLCQPFRLQEADKGEARFNLERPTPPTPGVFGEGLEKMLYHDPNAVDEMRARLLAQPIKHDALP